MNIYTQSLKKLATIAARGSKPGLSRIKKVLRLLGNPEKNFKSILIGGTNGKGSTTYFISKILLDQGYRVGTFISPPIFSIRERIQLNLKYISKKDFAKYFFKVYDAAKKMKHKPTFFEHLTAMALLYFYEKKVDFAVIEVGMGGRLDATNATEPFISVICSIGYDHTKHLGSTYREIAYEKCGIFRKNRIAIVPTTINARRWIEKYAKEKGAKLVFAKVRDFKTKFADFENSNIGCCLEVAKVLGIKLSEALNSIKNFSLRARWEKISTKPKIIIDCAHNPDAIKAILPSIKKEFKANKKNILVYASMKDKDYKKILKKLLPFFNIVIFTSPPLKRAQEPEKLAQDVEKFLKKKKVFLQKKPKKAFLLAKKLAAFNGNILIVGSIYLLQAIFAKEKFFTSG
ncbi:MAG: bifunctional folylpolyglutamate synthase/dihydrofolate synthase [Candidatus Micrarchaeota archaeon]|nr:bifunctional folylpolyglutamate synthase/dihydrofolate synthase [Candidatus Micrarchaeota archaeon]